MGKTTLARILALHLGIDDIVEIDAASRSGVDDMRALAEQSQLSSLIGDRRIVIVDECHALSKQAWQPLLKIMEEPPSHLFWALCTTEGAKVPETIRTRCQEYKLQPVSNIELENMLDDMCETCDLPSAVKGQLVHYARGSARRLLSGAEMVYELDDPDQSRELLRQADESSESPAITCARLILSKRLSYERLRQLFPQMVEQNAESARIVMVRYIHQAALKAATIESADAALYALDVLRGPLSETTGESELLVALCALIPRKDAP